MRNDDSIGTSIVTIIICIILIVAIVTGKNSCSEPMWNNGNCPKCEIKYELRGVSNALKYYSCPECGQEVGRY